MTRRELAEARRHDLDDAVRDAHILVATGAGGVGKTTTAAALGLAAAREGRRTLVLTIDPARRLAQAMGLDGLGDEPTRVPLGSLGEADGGLWAMVLDTQTTFDRLVRRHAPSPRQAAAIIDNRVYRTLSSTLSGTHEYMAMERLHELHENGTWDLLVVDTPPTRSALDFLDAPKRMSSFLEGRLLQAFLQPSLAAGRGLGRMVGAGATRMMRIAARVTGTELLDDLADFFRDFDGMYDGFKQRADEVLALLREPDAAFVVVTAPEPPALGEARFLLQRMEQDGLHAAGLVVNRLRPDVPREPSDGALRRAVARLGGSATAENGRGDPDAAVAAALELLGEVRRQARRQRHDVDAALYGVTPPALVEVPLLGSDVHDLDTLARIADTLTLGSTR